MTTQKTFRGVFQMVTLLFLGLMAPQVKASTVALLSDSNTATNCTVTMQGGSVVTTGDSVSYVMPEGVGNSVTLDGVDEQHNPILSVMPWVESSPRIRFESRAWAEEVRSAASADPTVVVMGGRLVGATPTWTFDKTFLVTNSVYVPSGVTLTIQAGTVVKFCPGTFIKIEDGGALNIVGAEGQDVILTAANDNTVGSQIVGFDETPITFGGIVIQSSAASFSENGYVQTRGFKFGNFPTLTLNNTTAFAAGGVARIPVTLNGVTREKIFSIDWVAEVDGEAFTSGKLTWSKTGEGTKTIEVAFDEAFASAHDGFTIRVVAHRGCNVSSETCAVTLSQWVTLPIVTGTSESAAVAYDARGTATGKLVRGEVTLGELKGGAATQWDTTGLLDGWQTATVGTNSTELLVLNDATIAIEGGRLAANTTWDNTVTHLVRNSVYVPSGKTLTITAGSIVKFGEDTFIKVEDGGKLTVVGAAGQDVIFTPANDNTVGTPVPGLDDETITYGGVWVQSGSATYSDNSYVQLRGFNYGSYPTLTLNDATLFATDGVAYLPVTLNGVTRNAAFSIEWEAVVDGEVFRTGSLTWSKTGDGTKIVEIPFDRTFGEAHAAFTVRIVTHRACNVGRGEATVTLLKRETLALATDIATSPTARYEGREGETAAIVRGEVILGEPDGGAATQWDTTGLLDGWQTATVGTNATELLVLNDATIALEGGRLAANVTWDNTVTHLVRNSVYVPSGKTLTITAGSIVKFGEGTFIKVEDGGKLNVVGAAGQDVIFTPANDNTVGTPVPGLGDETITYGGVWVQSGSATYTDNSYVQLRQFNYGNYPTVTLNDAVALRKNGGIYLALTLSGATRNQAFSIDWKATDDTAKLGQDYTVASGSVTWSKSSEGTKWIYIPFNTDEVAGETRTFTVSIDVARAVNVARGVATAQIDEYENAGLNGDEVTVTVGTESAAAPIQEDIAEQVLFLNEVETIQYSGRWQNYPAEEATKLRVSLATDNGVTVLKETTPEDTGSVALTLADWPVGFYTLLHEIENDYGEIIARMSKSFSVLDVEGYEWHAGTLTQNERWTADKVHVVYSTVYVPALYTLFVEPGAVVKFMTGAGIDISQGGAFFGDSIIFTHVNDDTIGGDVLSDGYTVAPPMDAYFLNGNFTFGDDTELRNITQKTALSGTISSDKKLSRGSVYRVSGTLTIASGATLTIPAGTVLKMESGATINVNSGATLKAEGTRAQPIIMTSIKDDSVGGDTNGDGDKTMPSGGDWSGVWVYGKADFNYTTLMHAGPSNERGILQTSDSGELTLTNCIVAHARFDGIWNWGGSIVAKNTIVFDTGYATAPYRGSKNEYTNCVFYGNNVGLCYWSHWTGKPVYKNCIFNECAYGWCETGANQYTNPQFRNDVTITNSCFWNPIGYGLQTSDKIGQNGNIWGNPLFVDPMNGDFRIVEGSPCVDAADSTVAPEVDYYGQPRITMTEQEEGAELVGQLADIGICEVMPRDITSDIDLVPLSVRTASEAKIGELLFVKWEVQNVGGAEVSTAWRDTILLVSESGRTVTLGEKVAGNQIAAGGTVFCSGYFVVPAIEEGAWYVKVNVNSYRDIFEGSLIQNNALTGDRPITLSLEALDADTTTEGVVNANTPKVLKFTYNEGDTNRMMTVKVPAGVKVTWGFDFVPQGVANSGSMIADANGATFRVPENATDVYVVIESDTTAEYEVSTESTQMVVTSVYPNRIPNDCQATMTVSGAGISNLRGINLIGDRKTLSPNKCEILSDAELHLTFDVTGWQEGEYTLSFVNDDNTLNYPLTIYSDSVGAQLDITLEYPTDIRLGRWYTAKVVCQNIGDANASAPLVFLGGNGVTFVDPDNGVDQFHGMIRLFCLSTSGDPLTIKPNEKIEVPVQFMTLNDADQCVLTVKTYKPGEVILPWSSIVSSDDATMTKVKEYYENDTEKMLAAMYQISTVGKPYGVIPKCAESYLRMAIEQGAGEMRTVVVGRVFDTLGNVLANTQILIVNTDTLQTYLSRTSQSGGFVLANVAHGQYVTSTGDNESYYTPGVFDVAADIQPLTLTYWEKDREEEQEFEVDETPRLKKPKVITLSGKRIVTTILKENSVAAGFLDEGPMQPQCVTFDGLCVDYYLETTEDERKAVMLMVCEGEDKQYHGYLSYLNLEDDSLSFSSPTEIFTLENCGEIAFVRKDGKLHLAMTSSEKDIPNSRSLYTLSADATEVAPSLNIAQYASNDGSILEAIVEHLQDSGPGSIDTTFFDTTIYLGLLRRHLKISGKLEAQFGQVKKETCCRKDVEDSVSSELSLKLLGYHKNNPKEAIPGSFSLKLSGSTTSHYLCAYDEGGECNRDWKINSDAKTLETGFSGSITIPFDIGTWKVVEFNGNVTASLGYASKALFKDGALMPLEETLTVGFGGSVSASLKLWIAEVDDFLTVSLNGRGELDMISGVASGEITVAGEAGLTIKTNEDFDPKGAIGYNLGGVKLSGTITYKNGEWSFKPSTEKVNAQGVLVSIDDKKQPSKVRAMSASHLEGGAEVEDERCLVSRAIGIKDDFYLQNTQPAYLSLNEAKMVAWASDETLADGKIVTRYVATIDDGDLLMLSGDDHAVFNGKLVTDGRGGFVSVYAASKISEWDDTLSSIFKTKLYFVTGDTTTISSPEPLALEIEGNQSIRDLKFSQTEAGVYLFWSTCTKDSTSRYVSTFKNGVWTTLPMLPSDEHIVSGALIVPEGNHPVALAVSNAKALNQEYDLEEETGTTGILRIYEYDRGKNIWSSFDKTYADVFVVDTTEVAEVVSVSQSSSSIVTTLSTAIQEASIVTEALHSHEPMARGAVTLMSSGFSRDDGCDENCHCDCRFHYSCGCPQTCPCAGNCKEGDACCKCTDRYGMPIHKSFDPNEMAGPLGIGDPETERFVKPGDWMTYTVYFENKRDATAAAQEVRVTNPLSQYLDWSTFEMGEVSFNNQIDLGLNGKQTGASEVALNNTAYKVKTTVALDQTKGEVNWYLRIVDPSTETTWPEDVYAGILPPNDETHRGEGHLTYRVKVREDVPAGVRIDNSATIIFDYNEPIETDPAWWNRVVPSQVPMSISPEATLVDEGETIEVKVFGGDLTRPSSAQVYLSYHTAAAADLDLAKATVTGVNQTAPSRTKLAIPLTLNWATGEVGEQTIRIPVKADKAVEDEETFTLQLANPENMALGSKQVCMVTLHDTNAKELKAAVTPYKPKPGESPVSHQVTVGRNDGAAGFVAGSGEYTAGSKLTLTAEARPGYAFVGWALQEDLENLLSTNPKYQIVVGEDGDYVAVFEPIPYVRGLATPAEGGKVTGSGYCADGKKVTLKASANKNFVFKGWYAASVENPQTPDEAVCVATTPSLVIDRTAKPTANSKTSTTLTDIDEDVTFFALFEGDPRLGLTMMPESAGKVTGAGRYLPGTKVTLKATPNKGYVFAGWYQDEAFTMPCESMLADYRNPSYTYVTGAADATLHACFVPAEEDQVLTLTVQNKANDEIAETFTINGKAEFALLVDSKSLPKVSVKGLPAGLKFTAKPVMVKGSKTEVEYPINTIYGTPTKPGIYTVTVSLTNSTIKKAITKTFEINVLNFTDDLIQINDSYGPYTPGVSYTETISAAEGCTVSGLPAGMKWTAKDIYKKGSKTEIETPANSVYGAPTKPGNYTVYFTKTVDKVKHTATATFKVGPYPQLTVDVPVCTDGTIGGKVTGAGGFAANKKVTLKATPTRGYVFAGWYQDEAFTMPCDSTLVDYRNPSYTYVTGATDVTFHACFVPAEEDQVLTLTVQNKANDEIAETFTINGKAEFALLVDSKSLPKVSVKGLPAGMKFTATPVMVKGSKTEVEYPINTIYGTPTKPGIYTVTVSLTNSTIKKAITKTFEINVLNFTDDLIQINDSYGPYTPGVSYTETISAAEGCTVSSLPAGMKWTAKDIYKKGSKTEIETPANSVYGAPTKPGNYTVYFTKTVDKVKHTATATFIVGPYPQLTVEVPVCTDGTIGGKVTGAGDFAANKKVTLKATPNKGYVFAGWYKDSNFDAPCDSTLMDYRNPSYTYVMGEDDAQFYARFVTKEEEADYKMGIALYPLDTPTLEIDELIYKAGEAILPIWVMVDSLTLPKVTMKGLPKGMKFDAKTFTISGMPTQPSDYVVYVEAVNASKSCATVAEFYFTITHYDAHGLHQDEEKVLMVDAFEAGEVVLNETFSDLLNTVSIKSFKLPTGLTYDLKTNTIRGNGTLKSGSYTATLTDTEGRVTTFTIMAELADEDKFDYYDSLSFNPCRGVVQGVNGGLGWMQIFNATDSSRFFSDAETAKAISVKVSGLPTGLKAELEKTPAGPQLYVCELFLAGKTSVVPGDYPVTVTITNSRTGQVENVTSWIRIYPPPSIHMSQELTFTAHDFYDKNGEAREAHAEVYHTINGTSGTATYTMTIEPPASQPTAKPILKSGILPIYDVVVADEDSSTGFLSYHYRYTKTPRITPEIDIWLETDDGVTFKFVSGNFYESEERNYFYLDEQWIHHP